jgi:NadR type nicotinamide-nucleotide adenylyltransferase
METIARGNRLIRVVLTGSECTGKSVLARELADHYGAELVPEFLRDFAMKRESPLGLADADEIARGQIALGDEHAARARRLLIEDTDVLSSVVYNGHYYGQGPAWIADAARERRPDLYLLLEIDVPWIADGVRDRGSHREEMQQLFRDAVARSGSDYVVIQGTWEQRSLRARAAIDRLLG